MGSVQLPVVTRSLVLRHFALQDAETVLALSREEAARTWLPSQVYRDLPHARSVLGVLVGQYQSPADPRRGPYVLAVTTRSAGTLIGHVGFGPLDGEVEIGFAIGRDHQGRGLATEAVVAASRWAFRSFGLARIVGIAATANVASRRTLARAGFAWERDERMSFQGTDQAVSVYALTPGL